MKHRSAPLATVYGRVLAIAILACPVASAGPADRFGGAEVKATPVAGAVHMLEGAGGNIGVSVGEDGVLIVDDQFAPLAERIEAAIVELGGAAPRFVLNTHFHGDHTGGNAHFGRSGLIVAHENVRVRLASGGAAAPALPVVTYRDRIRIHFNGDDIDVIHLPSGHTDGDSVVWFRSAGVVHMGDHFFSGRFPFVDIANGGSVAGLIANIESVLGMIPADTRVIPGHGPLGGVDELRVALGVIQESAAAVRKAMADGTLGDLKRDGFGRWSEWGSGFINEGRWISIVEQSERGVSPSF